MRQIYFAWSHFGISTRIAKVEGEWSIESLLLESARYEDQDVL